MTAKEFGAWVESYYAPYQTKTQMQEVWEYLKGKSPEFLDALKTVVRDRFSGQYGRAPDVAVFVSFTSEALDRMQAARPAITAGQEDYFEPVVAKDLMAEILRRAKRESEKRRAEQEK